MISFNLTGKQCSANGDSSEINKGSNEENLLPLELVINKDCKSKENHYVSNSDELRSSSDLRLENDLAFNDNGKTDDSETVGTVSNVSDKVYMPKIEPNDMVLNIQARLINGNERNDSATLQNRSVRKYTDVMFIGKFIYRLSSHINHVTFHCYMQSEYLVRPYKFPACRAS